MFAIANEISMICIPFSVSVIIYHTIYKLLFDYQSENNENIHCLVYCLSFYFKWNFLFMIIYMKIIYNFILWILYPYQMNYILA